jgi:hypothetical protein
MMFVSIPINLYGEHFGTQFLLIYTDILLSTILIGQQIVFNIKKLIRTIYEHITIVHPSKNTDTHIFNVINIVNYLHKYIFILIFFSSPSFFLTGTLFNFTFKI